MKNCDRCQFLAECVKPYHEYWSHLDDAAREKVAITLSRSIIPISDRLFKVTINWQRQDNEEGELEIQVAVEVSGISSRLCQVLTPPVA